MLHIKYLLLAMTSLVSLSIATPSLAGQPKQGPFDFQDVSPSTCELGDNSGRVFDDFIERKPPIMAARARRSGMCRAVLDLNAKGEVSRVQTITCTEKPFIKTSVTSIQGWTANTEKPVCGVVSFLSFFLYDEEIELHRMKDGTYPTLDNGEVFTSGSRLRVR